MKDVKTMELNGTGPKKVKVWAWLTGLSLFAALMLQHTWSAEHFTGAALVAGLLFVILYRDITRYQPQYLRKRRMLVLLGLMTVLTLGLSRLFEFVLLGLAKGLELDAAGAAIYGVPVAFGAMLVTLLFDFHTAIIFTFVVSLLTGLWQGDPTFAIYAFVGSLAGAFSMISCKKRTAILRGGAIVLGANLATLITILLFKGLLLTTTAYTALGFSIISALTVVALVSLLLPLLEYVFKVTTDISLLELLDLDHPLMRNLMLSAPGTYHHSLIVGNLVDACAEAVGINPLLARVGAYYHDIGKTKMPEYFIENSPSGVSKHEHLNPHMSSMILTSHVKEGVELADQYKLPEEVKDIIQQHHGTALIKYFYEKARGQENGDTSMDEYKYPGPRPQSRIAALIMMADAVEAASRVLRDPTPARISALVDKIINHIFLQGQLDECELTLKDIYEIKGRFTRILTSILHKRIDYPGFDFNKEQKTAEGKGIQQPAQGETQSPADTEGLPKGPHPAGARKG